MQSGWIFRIVVAIVLISAFLISGSFRRRARQTSGTIPRAAEGGGALILRSLGGLLIFGTYLLYVVAPASLDFSRMGLPLGFRVTGIVLGLACIPFLYSVFVSIGANISETVLTKDTHQLVTSGPYRWIRHPLYAGAMWMMLAFGLIADSWLMLIYWVVAVLVFRLIVIPAEEAHLTSTFGDRYVEYIRWTGALLPGRGVPANNIDDSLA